MRLAPRFEYDTDEVLQLTLAQRWWQPEHTVGFGDSDMSDAGIPFAYVVRWDEKVEVTLRFTEAERAAVMSMVMWMVKNKTTPFTFYFEAGGQDYLCYLESPKVGERIRPIRSMEDHEVFELSLTLRSTDGTRFHFPVMSDVFEATGGVITEDGSYTIHTFTEDGVFEVLSGEREVEVLMVGGGGGGGNINGTGVSTGGGGGGGVIHEEALLMAPGAYPIAIGLGGANSAVQGTDGGDTTFNGLTAEGGGGGGASTRNGRPGGSGGGGASANASPGTGGAATLGQGSIGGDGGGVATARAGGGGGAGQAGSNGVIATPVPGKGGDGLVFDISGSNQTYGGGGGGGGGVDGSAGAAGGTGGGGAGGGGGAVAGTAGTDGRGGGGGGTVSGGGLLLGGPGGDGVVIIRYLTN